MSSSPPPPRRFKPEHLETSARSSRLANSSSRPSSSSSPGRDKSRVSNTDTDAMSPQSRPRKFVPQPVEESVRSSRKKNVEHVEDNEPKGTSTNSSSPHNSYSHYDDPTLPGIPNSRPLTTPRRFTPEPVESSTRSPRRKFAPEPIETSTRSSKDKEEPQEEAASRPRRKFATEPVETSTRSSKSKESDAAEENQTPRPRRKFAPEPIETTKTTRRRRDTVDSDDADSEPLPSGDSLASSRASSGPRKWQPELLETAKGSYRRVYPSKETALRRPPPSPSLSEEETVDEGASVGDSRFSAATLARKQSGQSRQHSFQVPDLPMIESTTEESESPSLSDCTSSIDTDTRKDDNQSSEKDNYTEYVLRLARETVTEAELQEAAMAAYINERPHEPVDHFAFAQDDDEDGPLPVPMFQGESGADARTFRRSSADELDLELEGMRKHHEQLERTKKDVEAETAGPSRFSAAAVAARHAKEAKAPQKSKKPRPLDEDSEFSRMRAAASPPMLGDDLVFPFTISPKMTRCDPDQPPRPRNAESDDDESRDVGSPHLWISDTKIKNDGSEGLWMGMCQAGMWQPRSQRDGLRSGIQTPAPGTPATERFNPFEVAMPVRGSLTPGRGAQTPGRRRPVSGISFLPLTPPRSQDGDEFTNTIDKKLQLEKQIEEEFPPRVITQIYNYLSLGYPSLAHMFDEELSKISRIQLEELRKDDYQADAKGYVGAPEGDGCDESQVIGGRCKRWEALKVYVHEWARQSPNFVDERRAAALGADEDWGARARKGSWGQ